MKKKTGIITSLLMLFILIYSCEHDDQIDTFKSSNTEFESEKSSNDPLNILTDREEDNVHDCDKIFETDLIAGQHIVVGQILIRKDGDQIKVTYDLSSSNWYLKESHLFLGDIANAPFGNSGNPKIGQFPYHGDHNLVKQYSFFIPLDYLEECFSLISHASVVLTGNGDEKTSETAFGFGEHEFSGNRWGWYADICKSDCEEDQINQDLDSENNGSDNDLVNQGDFDENSDNTNHNEESEGCMDAYAYSSEVNSICFLNDFTTWGWSNKVKSNDRHYAPGGLSYSYPLYASAYDCAIDNSILIGEVTMTISGGDSILYADIEVSLSKQELSITDIHIVANETVYPIDENGQASIDFDNFDVNLNSMNEKTYSVTWLDWFEETYFIVHVKVCPEEILQ